MKIDYLNPNYTLIYKERAELLEKIRSSDKNLSAAKTHYKYHPWDLVKDWGMTLEPRNIELGRPAIIPFVPFPRQIEFMKWLHQRWLNSERCLVEKSRDFGATWLFVGYACAMFLAYPGFTVGIGSRKEDLVDKKGDPKSIFEKIRMFLDYLPMELMPKGWNAKEHAGFLKITNPVNGATITGESGDDIGRGARMSIYFVDEAAFLPRQDSVDAALSQTTNCQVDISTVKGNGNLFFKKRHSGNIPVFVMDWRDDPRKTQEWYEKQKREQDPVKVAQEIDRDYNASRENIFIPGEWVKAAIDAHVKLGFPVEGMRRTAFDPADVGDPRGHVYMHGSVILEAVEQKDGDIRHAVNYANEFADEHRAEELVYDADGMGSPAIKLSLQSAIGTRTRLHAFYGSAEVMNGNACDETGKRLKDRYKNRRAQRMGDLRERFQRTYSAVVNKRYSDPSGLISISSKCKNLHELVSELSRAERQYTEDGKIRVESKQAMKKRGVQSPNLADCVMMLQEPPEFAQTEVYIPRPVAIIGGAHA